MLASGWIGKRTQEKSVRKHMQGWQCWLNLSMLESTQKTFLISTYFTLEVCWNIVQLPALLARYVNIHEPTHVISGCTGMGRFQNLQRPVTYTHDGWSYTRGLRVSNLPVQVTLKITAVHKCIYTRWCRSYYLLTSSYYPHTRVYQQTSCIWPAVMRVSDRPLQVLKPAQAGATRNNVCGFVYIHVPG